MRRPLAPPGPLLRFLEGLDGLLFPLPRYCLACGRDTGGPGPFFGGVCPECFAGWRREVAGSAPPCGEAPSPPGWSAPGGMTGHAFPGGGLARARRAGVLARVEPVGLYRGPLRDLIHRFKYGGERWLGRPLGELMAAVAVSCLPRPDLLVPVPLTRARQRQRGFNQARDLARVVGGLWRVPVVDALERDPSARRQAGLGRADRWDNLRGAFRPLTDLGGATITLVDDVFTTGATVANCTAALARAGAARVDALVLASVPAGGP